MYKKIILTLSLFSLLLPFNLHAESQPKKFNLGIGTYAFTIVYADPFIADETFSGTAFVASYAFSNNIAVRGNLYSTEFDLGSELEASGSDIVLLFGTGMENEGLKAYLGAGLFSEDWKISGFSESFSGLQVNAGIGYSWEVITLDLFIGIRDASDYNVLADTDTAVVSSSLSLSARF